MRGSGIDAHILQFWLLQLRSSSWQPQILQPIQRNEKSRHTLYSPQGKDKTGSTAPLVCVSTQFSCLVVSDSLWSRGLQHVRLPCPSPTPGACSNSCPLSRWCCPTYSSSVIPFSCLQSFPAWGSFQMSQFFTSGGQTIGVSASASILPVNIQDWFPLGWTGWISLQSKGLSRVFSNTIVQKHQFFGTQISL